MVPALFSGLYKLRDAVNIHDRFDTRVTDQELKYIGLKQLGDGQDHEVNGQTVPWFPYYGGTVKKSEYTVLGGITELNYNIQSGGAEFRVGQVGPAARVFTLSLAVDLRLVRTQTLEVVSAVSLQKQFTGYEIGFEIFRFFGINGTDRLFDVNIGNKSQEPLQLGIRAIIEEAAMRLIADATGVSYQGCMPEAWGYPDTEPVALASPPAPEVLLAAEPGSLEAGTPVRLSWMARNSSECEITPGIGSVPLSGSRDLVPAASTTYQLVCSGDGGTAESQATITVAPVPAGTGGVAAEIFRPADAAASETKAAQPENNRPKQAILAGQG